MKPAPVDPDPDLPYSHVPGKVVAKYRATRVDEDAPVDPVREAARVTGSEWAAVAKAWRAFREKYGEWEPWSRSPLVLRLNNVEPVALTAALDALAAALEKSE